MLLFLHSRRLERCSGLVDVVARPLAHRGQIQCAHRPYKPHQFTLFPARSLEFWAPKVPIMSSSGATDLPRGAWDSHVHVVDEVSITT